MEKKNSSPFIKPIIVVQEGVFWYFYYDKSIIAKVEKIWFWFKISLNNTTIYALTKTSAFDKVRDFFTETVLPKNTPFITLNLPYNELKRVITKKTK